MKKQRRTYTKAERRLNGCILALSAAILLSLAGAWIAEQNRHVSREIAHDQQKAHDVLPLVKAVVDPAAAAEHARADYRVSGGMIVVTIHLNALMSNQGAKEIALLVEQACCRVSDGTKVAVDVLSPAGQQLASELDWCR